MTTPPSSNSARWKLNGGRTAMKQASLPLALNKSIISGSGRVGEAVAVIRQKDLLVLHLVLHRDQTLPILRHTPVSIIVTRQSGCCLAEDLDLLAELRHDAIVGGSRLS